MRIVAAVVVGAVLFGMGHAASAAEARRQRSERCVEICNFTFEQCQKETSSKANGQCNIDAVRCKNACPFETIEEPAVPTAMSHARCIDGCRETYKKCTQKAANKRGGTCAADDVRCEQGCPKPPEETTIGAPGAPAGSAEPGTVPAAVAPAAKRPKRGNRVEGAAAPAPISPTPVVVPRERPAQPAVAPEPPAAAPARSEAVAPAASAPAPASAAARPAPEERGFFGTLGCFFVSCEPAGSTPCLLQCNTSYDECKVRESKRGGECNTRLMNCRRSCADAGR